LTVGKLIPALLAGCSIVLKPSPETPLDANLMAELLEQTGLPPGVVSVLPGDREIGEYLVSHPGVDKVSFTGSTAAGRQVAAACGANLKRVFLELGGKSAMVVLDDADPAAVADTDVAALGRWSATLPERVDGDRLVHTDLHGGQFVIGERDDVHVVDWGWPAAGAGWVDTAFMVVRLVEAGHHPASAEEWARSLRSWNHVDDETVTAFAAYVAGLWSYRASSDSTVGARRRAKTARDYATWRLAATH
nr:aldehyde dehydrogenase family protein [Micromonospora sp. DSM 115978]